MFGPATELSVPFFIHYKPHPLSPANIMVGFSSFSPRIYYGRQTMFSGGTRTRSFIIGALMAFSVLLSGVGVVQLNAQGSTATLLGTVADMSGAAIPEATVEAKNVGTGAAQTVVADPQGRFR